MQTKTRSILRYPGSKARFAPLIAEVITISGLRNVEFAEPFCGGSSVSIALLEEGIVDTAALNDADPLITALWSCVFNKVDAIWLAEQVHSIPLTIEEWRKQKNLNPATQREAALKCLYLNRTSFNGIIYKSGPIGGWGQERRTLGVRFNRDKLAERILSLSEHESRVTVSNYGWAKFCNEMSRRKSVFFYLDPPYYYKAEQLYGHIFDVADHAELRDHLLELESPWLLSYDDTHEVRALYHDHGLQARIVDNTYSTHPLGGGAFIGRELIYSNLNKLPPPDISGNHVGITVRDTHHFNAVPNPLRIPLSAYACELYAS